MSISRKQPGYTHALILLLLGIGASACGVDAIISDSVTSPSMHGDGRPVQGSETIFLGIGWIMIGLGLMYRAVACRLEASGNLSVSIGLCIVGAGFWAFALL